MNLADSFSPFFCTANIFNCIYHCIPEGKVLPSGSSWDNIAIRSPPTRRAHRLILWKISFFRPSRRTSLAQAFPTGKGSLFALGFIHSRGFLCDGDTLFSSPGLILLENIGPEPENASVKSCADQ